MIKNNRASGKVEVILSSEIAGEQPSFRGVSHKLKRNQSKICASKYFSFIKQLSDWRNCPWICSWGKWYEMQLCQLQKLHHEIEDFKQKENEKESTSNISFKMGNNYLPVVDELQLAVRMRTRVSVSGSQNLLEEFQTEEQRYFVAHIFLQRNSDRIKNWQVCFAILILLKLQH